MQAAADTCAAAFSHHMIEAATMIAHANHYRACNDGHCDIVIEQFLLNVYARRGFVKDDYGYEHRNHSHGGER